VEKAYRPEELSNILGVDVNKVHNYLLRYGIPFIKVGSSYWISDWDLREWIEKKTARNGSDEKE
jgi:excisionase family DNA binding protein